jgi:hypothetical protein
MAATLLWIAAGIADSPRDLNEDQRSAFAAGLLFAGALLVLEAVMFVIGRYLRQPYPDRLAEGTKKPGGRRLLPRALYLGGSTAIALFAAFFRTESEVLRPLFFLIGQPFIFAQLLLGGLLGIKLGSGVTKQAILVVANLLYFLVLFYPLYGVLTTDRVAEAVRFRRMTILLVCLGSVHVLIGLAFVVLAKA